MRIQLKAPHTHGGRKYPPGAQLDLADAKAQWLIAKGVAMAAPTDDADATAKTPAGKPTQKTATKE